MTIWFVTGTDTGVGKTIVTAALAAIHSGQGQRVAVVKPAQTGVADDEPGDRDEIRRLAGAVDLVEGVRLPHPLAPDRAAREAGRRLPSLAAQRDLIVGAAASHDVVLVEGSGGVVVNLGESFTLIDLALAIDAASRRLDWLVVARSGLGTLNHSRLTVSALRDRGLAVRGLVVGAYPAEPTEADRLNLTDLPRYTGVPLLGVLPDGASRLPPARFRAEAPQWLSIPHDPAD